MVRNAFHAIV